MPSKIISIAVSVVGLLPFAALSAPGQGYFSDFLRNNLPPSWFKHVPDFQMMLVSYATLMFMFFSSPHWGFAFANMSMPKGSSLPGGSDDNTPSLLSAGKKMQAFRLVYPALCVLIAWPCLHLPPTLALDVLSAATFFAFMVDLFLWMMGGKVPIFYLFIRIPIAMIMIASMQSNTGTIIPHIPAAEAMESATEP